VYWATAGGTMSNDIPQEGRWYSYRRSREAYQVINVDTADRVIYFQDLRGDIDEADFDEWFAMELQPLNDLASLDSYLEDDEDADYWQPQRAPGR
jgi:hypothetical protein